MTLIHAWALPLIFLLTVSCGMGIRSKTESTLEGEAQPNTLDERRTYLRAHTNLPLVFICGTANKQTFVAQPTSINNPKGCATPTSQIMTAG